MGIFSPLNFLFVPIFYLQPNSALTLKGVVKALWQMNPTTFSSILPNLFFISFSSYNNKVFWDALLSELTPANFKLFRGPMCWEALEQRVRCCGLTGRFISESLTMSKFIDVLFWLWSILLAGVLLIIINLWCSSFFSCF